MESAAARPIGWPGMVPSIQMMRGNPGIAIAPAINIINNRLAVLPMNNLFIQGFIQKSQG